MEKDTPVGKTWSHCMDKDRIRETYDAALKALAANTKKVAGYDRPVLTEGGEYQGVWLESGPQEGIVYGRHEPEIALANHDVFFHFQREDGWLPCWVRLNRAGYSQIQMVVPIAATALETGRRLSREDFLARAYDACRRWDDWLARYRNTRGTGLCEAFCEFDTGHDNSPRFAGLPKRCPDNDARRCPRAGKLPYLAPDLSASVYGGRVALAEMADMLDRTGESRRWKEKAELLRQRIIEHCFDPEDECFYDVDREGDFVKIRSDVLLRVLGEHVVEQFPFERIYARYIRNPDEFWTPFPLPSVSINDPAFDRNLRLNSWGGPSQALTALRAPRWFEHYGKHDDLAELMRTWVNAIIEAPAFMQEMNPWTGKFSTSHHYSPCMCVFVDFVDRLNLPGFPIT